MGSWLSAWTTPAGQRATNLDELAALYRVGAQRFFTDWQAFTDTTTPMLLSKAPRLVLVARSFDDRTESALSFLSESGVPLKLIQVVFYQDADGSRIVDVHNGDLGSTRVDSSIVSTPNPPPDAQGKGSKQWIDRLVATAKQPRIHAQASSVTVMDLLEAGVLEPKEPIRWSRPQVGQVHTATIGENGEVVLTDGRSFTSLSLAANELAG